MRANELSGFCEWNGRPRTRRRRKPDDDRDRRPRAVALLGGDRDEVVPRAGDEVRELHLGDGRIPMIAAPVQPATIAVSESGESITRQAPNSSWKPSVTLNAPPDADVLADHEHTLVAPHLAPGARPRSPAGRSSRPWLLVVGVSRSLRGREDALGQLRRIGQR